MEIHPTKSQIPTHQSLHSYFPTFLIEVGFLKNHIENNKIHSQFCTSVTILLWILGWFNLEGILYSNCETYFPSILDKMLLISYE